MELLQYKNFIEFYGFIDIKQIEIIFFNSDVDFCIVNDIPDINLWFKRCGSKLEDYGYIPFNPFHLCVCTNKCREEITESYLSSRKEYYKNLINMTPLIAAEYLGNMIQKENSKNFEIHFKKCMEEIYYLPKKKLKNIENLNAFSFLLIKSGLLPIKYLKMKN